MHIKQLDIKHFRNYTKESINCHPNINILVGNNAQGKTSILEAIYVLALTKSHRINKERDVIQTGADFAKIHSVINLDEHDAELDIIVSKVGKKAKYNGIEIEKLSEYIGTMFVVMFAPEDLDLVKGSPGNRRRFLNVEIGQISRDYVSHLQQYRLILKQRNDLLKGMNDSDKDMMLLDIITDQLLDELQTIVTMRSRFIKEISNHAKTIYSDLSDSKDILKLVYTPSIDKKFKEEFAKKIKYDSITQTTNLGAHRDDIEFHLNNKPLKTFGSQGEQRTAVLSIKLALLEFIYSKTKCYPILLLDDVFSELDPTRQAQLLKRMQQITQTFITTTHIKHLSLNELKQYKIYNVNQGTIKERESHAS